MQVGASSAQQVFHPTVYKGVASTRRLLGAWSTSPILSLGILFIASSHIPCLFSSLIFPHCVPLVGLPQESANMRVEALSGVERALNLRLQVIGCQGLSDVEALATPPTPPPLSIRNLITCWHTSKCQVFRIHEMT